MSDEREIQQVLARYVRAADQRDGAAMSNIFLPEGRVEIFYNNAGQPELIGELVGSEAIGAAVTTMMKPHPPRGWSHHTTHDPIINVKGDTGTLDAQFVVFNVLGEEKPEAGWLQKGPLARKGLLLASDRDWLLPADPEESRWALDDGAPPHLSRPPDGLLGEAI